MTTAQNDPVLPLPEDQPLVDLWPTAAHALGIGRTAAYDGALRQSLPVQVLRIGGRYRVRTAELRAFLGLDTR